MNQTRPHCVNQMGKTHSKPLAARHGRGTAWSRHGHSMLYVNRPLGSQAYIGFRVSAEMCLGHSGRTDVDRCKEHKRYIRQHQAEKSAVADNSISMGHCFDFCGTSLLGITSGYVDGLVKEEVEIRLTKNNCNTDGGFILSHAWSPITLFINVKAGPHKSGT